MIETEPHYLLGTTHNFFGDDWGLNPKSYIYYVLSITY